MLTLVWNVSLVYFSFSIKDLVCSLISCLSPGHLWKNDHRIYIIQKTYKRSPLEPGDLSVLYFDMRLEVKGFGFHDIQKVVDCANVLVTPQCTFLLSGDHSRHV